MKMEAVKKSTTTEPLRAFDSASDEARRVGLEGMLRWAFKVRRLSSSIEVGIQKWYDFTMDKFTHCHAWMNHWCIRSCWPSRELNLYAVFVSSTSSLTGYFSMMEAVKKSTTAEPLRASDSASHERSKSKKSGTRRNAPLGIQSKKTQFLHRVLLVSPGTFLW
ncbi:hypothetical protein F2Q70_00042330 [Brassica cretica]|uniref:Uncharacterized protein n=1 Tax=Brassica cretica TaxID=69181 RepID=A0A8S9KN76_BRACR|nr:hypothetical protein F2Q70_00042330 [Brassica cretica]